MRLLMIVGLVLALGACATDGSTTRSEAERIELGCLAAGTAVQVLTVANANNELTAAQQETIEVAIGTVGALCANPPTTFAELKARGFVQALLVLQNQVTAYLARKPRAEVSP